MAKEDGYFKPGNPGRPKGSKNKVSKAVREAIGNFVNDNVDNVQMWFDDLDYKDKLFYLKEFLPFVIPKMKEIKSDPSENTPLFDYDKMSLEEKRILFELFAKYTGYNTSDSSD